MKRLFVNLMAFSFLFAFCFKAEAELIQYTFEGAVSNIYDYAGYIEEFGMNIGDPVQYVWVVDENSDALWIHEDGTTQILLDEFGVDKFYTNVISGDYLPRQESGTIGSPGLVANKGTVDMIYQTAFLEAGRRDDLSFLKWPDYTAYPSTWTIGDNYFTMFERVYNIYGWKSKLYSSLTLTDISSAVPVPEPNTIFLILIGLIGMRFKNSSHK